MRTVYSTSIVIVARGARARHTRSGAPPNCPHRTCAQTCDILDQREKLMLKVTQRSQPLCSLSALRSCDWQWLAAAREQLSKGGGNERHRALSIREVAQPHALRERLAVVVEE